MIYLIDTPEEPLISNNVKLTFWVKCNTRRPERTHHCSICQICVLRMDHHCAWISNCVGQFNHKYYILFLIYTSLLTWMMAIINSLAIISLTVDDVKVWSLEAAYYELSGVTSFVICALTTNLAIYQTKMISLDRTTLEDLTNQFDKNKIRSLQNAELIMGERVVFTKNGCIGFFITVMTSFWWLPTSPKFHSTRPRRAILG